MADKRRIKKSLKRLRIVKTWQLLILLILMGFVAATLLRMNNVGMVQRRNALFAADKSSDIYTMRSRLSDLQRYSASHMNASTNVFYLQDSYNRDAKAAIDAANQAGVGSGANAAAEAVCKPQFSGYSTAYLQCFLRELEKHPTSDKLPEADMPNPALYRYEFASPLWTPDFAGWAIVACAVIVLLILSRLLGLVLLQILLKRHYQDI